MTDTSTVDIDAVAAALMPNVILPFDVPRRPFQLGAPDGYCIRPDYVSRDGPCLGSDTCASRAGAHIGAHSIEARLVGVMGRERVVASHGEIERHADPAALVDRLARRLDEASVLVLSTALRSFTMTGDDPGPPVNPAHLREWTFPELQAFLDAMGLDVLFGGVCAGDSDASTGEIGVIIALRGP